MIRDLKRVRDLDAHTNESKLNEADLPTVRAWRNDTITAVDSHASFTKRATSIERELTSDLRNCLRGALSGENENSIKWSLCKEVIVPAMGLAHKVCLHIQISPDFTPTILTQERLNLHRVYGNSAILTTLLPNQANSDRGCQTSSQIFGISDASTCQNEANS
jgi:hypothetical protein